VDIALDESHNPKKSTFRGEAVFSRTLGETEKGRRRRRGKEGKKEERMRMRKIEYSTISTAITNLN
jgi:hypothetical protein